MTNSTTNDVLLSVVIPTYNRNDLLEKCLINLAPGKQTLDPSLYEVIVTDDSKEKKAESFVKDNFPWAKCMEGPHKGPASKRNNGAKHTTGAWLVFIDDDCLAVETLLTDYYEAIKKNKEIKAFEGSIFPLTPLIGDLVECPVNTEGGCFWSANICIQKDLFSKIGGFDETYLIAAQEDQDIYLRIQDFTSVLFIISAKVFHPIRKVSLLKSIKGINKKCLNWLYFAQKNKLKLGFSSKKEIIIFNYKFHIITFIRVVKGFKPKQSVIELIMIFYGIPFMIINLYSNKRFFKL